MAGPLRVGDALPRFAAHDTAGRVWTEADFRGAPFVLYFYPRDDTPGCTREAGAYRDLWPDFSALGVQVVGVSRDEAESHRRFAEKGCLPFVLLSDPGGEMHERFGAFILGTLPRRVSYLVGADGRIAAVFDSHLRPGAHAERMLAAAQDAMAGSARRRSPETAAPDTPGER